MYFNVKNLGPHKYKNTAIEQVFSPYDNSEIGEVECINESDVENGHLDVSILLRGADL